MALPLLYIFPPGLKNSRSGSKHNFQNIEQKLILSGVETLLSLRAKTFSSFGCRPAGQLQGRPLVTVNHPGGAPSLEVIIRHLFQTDPSVVVNEEQI
jgi:hypothetical protein